MKNKLLLAVLIIFLGVKAFGQVTVTGTDTIGCGSTCTTLTAHLIGDVPINCSIGSDDIYSTPFTLGFTFNFYGTNYTQVLVGANGNLSFDMGLAGSYDPWPISAALLGNTSVYNCICGPWCDIDYADFGGSCWYSTDGVAPNRKFVVSFCKTYMYTSSLCPGQFTTSQMILYETSNIVEVHIANKTICTSWNSGRAICGVQNATGTAATAAPGRDWTPNWSVYNEAWRFTPTGGGTAYTVTSIPYAPVPFSSSQIYWYDSATYAFVDSGFTATVCPTVTTTYKAGALGCADTSYGYRRVVVAPCGVWGSCNFPCVGDTLKLYCDGDSLGATYSWTLLGGAWTSTQQDPYIYPSTWSDTGTFRAIRTIGTMHDTIYVHVGLHPLPSLTLTSNGPLCAITVDTLLLTASPDSVGESFVWTGPGGFTSTLANPTINGFVVTDTGFYKVVATTRYGCKDSAMIDVSTIAPPALSVDSPLVKTCLAVPVNLHVYTVPGGTWSYVWTPATFLSSSTIPNPVVNPTATGDFTYTVSVSPVGYSRCANKDTIHVHVVPNDFTLSNPDTIICRGQSVQTRVSGGSPEFTWAWTPTTGVSNPIITNPLITPPSTLIYSITASYAHCPDMVHSFKITVDTPAIPVTIHDTICLGMTQNVNLSFAGSGFYNFTWTPATYLSSSTSSNVNITPTAIGDYAYTITVSPGTSPAGCTITDNVTLHVAPNDFVLSNPDTVICRGQTVTARVTGSAEFTYLWTPPSGVSNVNITTPTITPTTTTTYTITASYSPHCPDMHHHFTITVDTPAIPVTIHDTICLGMTDNVNLSFPGSGFYNYIWSPVIYLSTSTASTVTITPLTIGTFVYNVTVSPGTSPAGCTITDVVSLHVAPNDFILGNNDTAICLGKSVQTIVNGSSEFSYVWTPATGVAAVDSMNTLLTPTVSTGYTITASYAPHCPDMVHHFFIEVDTLAHPITINDTVCLGTSDTVNLTFPDYYYYHFGWSSTPLSNLLYVSNDSGATALVTPTSMGNYNYTITVFPKAYDCAVNDILNLLVVPNSFIISPTDTSICAGNSVQIRGVPYPLFKYQWIPTAGIAISNQIAPLITPDTTTTYIVTAFYKKCPLMVDTMRLTVEPNPSVFMGGNRFVCEYDTLHLTAQVSPEWYKNYSFSWSPGTSLNDSTSQTVVFEDTLSKKMVVTVTTPAGCIGKDSALITVYPGNFMEAMSDLAFCPGDSAVLNPAGGVSYMWRPQMYLSDSIGNHPVIHAITSGTYSVIGTNAFGCKDTVNFNVVVYPAAVMYLEDSVTIYPGESYKLNPQTNCTNFVWFPSYGLDNSLISNPTATPDMNMLYRVTGSTEYGCKTVDSIIIYVSDETLLALPNAFTPGNGPNNTFKIIKRGIANLNYFRIFNRWGNIVFETTDIEKGWDGSYKGQPQPYDVYVYMIQATTNTGKLFTKQGNITLIK